MLSSTSIMNFTITFLLQEVQFLTCPSSLLLHHPAARSNLRMELDSFLEKIIAREQEMASCKPRTRPPNETAKQRDEQQQQRQRPQANTVDNKDELHRRATQSLASLYLSDKYIVLNRESKQSYFDTLIEGMAERESHSAHQASPQQHACPPKGDARPRRRETIVD